MRTREITFIKRSKEYNPEIGGNEVTDKVLGTMNANVTDVGIELSLKLFGELKQGIKEIHLMPYDEPPEGYTHILMYGKEWKEFTKRGDVRITLIIEEC